MKRKSHLNKGFQIGLTLLFFISLLIGIYNGQNNSNISSTSTPVTQDSSQFKVPLRTSNSLPIAPWWNESFLYRKQINITNRYNYNLSNYGVSFQFNYTELVSQGKMSSNLNDIRIVQNGTLLKYYYIKNSPTNDIATVWFQSNVSANSSNYDAYMYYGNNTVGLENNYYDNNTFGSLWYTFEDFNSSVAKDLMGQNNGTIFSVGNKTNYITGYMGKYALKFSDTQTLGFINVPYTAINGSGNFTICFWALPGVSGEYLISGMYGSTDNYMLMSSPTATGWHFYVWMRNGSTPHIYTDLVLTDSLIYSNPGNPVTITPGGFVWAQEQDSLNDTFDPNQAFSGSLDEIRIFKRDLSQTELTWLFNNNSLDVSLLQEEVKRTRLTIYVIDVDGKFVPGANVAIFNGSSILYTPQNGYFTNNTSENGDLTFYGIPFGKYNLTVNYTSTNGLIEIVNITLNYEMSKIQQNITINTILWTINFNITDVDTQPMETGWVIARNFTGDQEISNLTVNSSGIAVFRWLNHTVNWFDYLSGNPLVIGNILGYNYSVYYNNSNYYGHPLLVNTSIVTNINPHSIWFNVSTNLTKLHFNLYDSVTFNPLIGAEIRIIQNNNTATPIVNLSTDSSGQAEFRWLTIQAPQNYTLSIYFYGLKPFNISDNPLDKAESYNFTLSSISSLAFNITVDPSVYKTELISKNPSLLIVTNIGYNIEFYVLYNIKSNPGGYNGTAWAESVTWTLKQGTQTLNTGYFEKVENSQYNEGLYFLSLNTINERMTDSSKLYTLQVSASKIGFGEPQNIYYIISMQNVPTQLEADRDLNTPFNKYWKEDLNVLFTYKSDISEQTEIIDSYARIVNQSGSINLEPYITSFTNCWNLTGLYFNFSNIMDTVVGTQQPENMKMNVTYGSNKYVINNGAAGGTGSVNLTKSQLNWHQYIFQYGVEGNNLANYSVEVTAYFERWYTSSSLTISNSQISQGNITVDTPNDHRNLVYIQFKFTNIKNQSSSIVNASDVMMNITIPNYGQVFRIQNTGIVGEGILELTNYTLFPEDSVLNFIINSTNLKSYNVNISAGFDSTFQKNDQLEKTQSLLSFSTLYPSSFINITEPVNSWNLTKIRIEFSNLNQTSLNRTFFPSEAEMKITYNSQNYTVSNYETNGTGYVIIPLINESGNKTFIFSIISNLTTSFTYDVMFGRSYKNQITDLLLNANVIWQISSYSGPLSEVGSGKYNFTLNTSIFLPSTETKLINIIASKQYYLTNSSLYIRLILNERPTLLNNTKRNFYEIEIYALDKILISFNYTDELLGNILKSDANSNVSATYSWYKYETPNNVYNGILNEIGNYFVLDFNTDLKNIGKYVLGVNIKRDNYSQPQLTLLITIKQRSVTINTIPPVYTLPQKQTSMIIVSLKDGILGTPLSNFNLSYSIDGIPLGSLIPQADGTYLIPISTASMTLGAHYILISLQSDNYTMPFSTVSLTITYEQIFGLDAPIFYTILIAAIVAISAVSVYVTVKQVRIPYVIKKINESIKTIDKNKGELSAPVMKSKEKIFLEKFGGDWETLGLEPPIKPTKAISEFKDLLGSMKSVKMTDKEVENLKLKLSKVTKQEALKLLQLMGIPPDTSERLIELAKK